MKVIEKRNGGWVVPGVRERVYRDLESAVTAAVCARRLLEKRPGGWAVRSNVDRVYPDMESAVAAALGAGDESA